MELSNCTTQHLQLREEEIEAQGCQLFQNSFEIFV